MTVEIHAFDKCNIACTYCYEGEARSVEELQGAIKYDLEAILRTAGRLNQKFTTFGGEPLLFPLDDLEKIFSFGFNKFKGNGVQTNGTLITEDHIKLFKRYNVHVGISIDGPADLNDARRVGSLASTRRATGRTEENIKKLCEAQIVPSIISTIHRINAFLAFKSIIELPLKGLKFDTYEELKNLLTGTGPASCNWNGCDPYSTPAVQGIDGDGSLKNCGRTYKDGISWRKSNTRTNIRQLALYNLPQEVGGCKNCSYFAFCKGECPGESDDWRNKSDQCGLIKRLFGYIENRLRLGGIKVIEGEARKVLELRVVGSVNKGGSHLDSDHLDTPHIDEHDDIYRFEVPVISVYGVHGCTPDCHSKEHHHDAIKVPAL